ncbi:MAG: sulfite exporter TauE/SafE family protein [Planctomycetota bacterium]|nr:sulfite exporter TauE/SafE family protein [Planctomycetota bacterium]
MVEALVIMGILGLLVGFIAALLGIGGGMVMVPCLYYIFTGTGIIEETPMHYAAGTSLMIMIATSIGAVIAHARRGDVVWSITRRILPSISVGVVSGVIIATIISGQILMIVFGVVLAIVALTMIFGFKATAGRAERIPRQRYLTLGGFFIGYKSGMLGVGGGAISVPWLTWMGLPQPRVSGTSSTFTFPAAVIGAVAFCISGLLDASGPAVPWTIGYVFWPALPVAGLASVIGTRFGAIFSSRVPARQLRILFGLILIGVSISMIGSGFDTTAPEGKHARISPSP